jgi:hypothetical protein
VFNLIRTTILDYLWQVAFWILRQPTADCELGLPFPSLTPELYLYPLHRRKFVQYFLTARRIPEITSLPNVHVSCCRNLTLACCCERDWNIASQRWNFRFSRRRVWRRLCSGYILVEVYWRFRGACFLRRQGYRPDCTTQHSRIR